MAYGIEEIEGIGPAYAEKLSAANIATTDDLLKLCASKSGRADTADVFATGGGYKYLQMGEAVPRWGPVEGEVRDGYPSDYSLAQVEAAHIRGVLEQSGGHIGRAAEVLGIHRNTLARKVQEYQIEPSGRASG